MLSSLPKDLLSSLEGVKGFDAAGFLAVHSAGRQETSIRLNPLKCTDPSTCFAVQENARTLERVPWSSMGYYLEQRPSFTFDPLFHAGVYYVQEASSMFVEQALRQGTDLTRPLRVLDLCAAPGGKSTLIQSLISADSLLVSNEVIRSRAAVLQENITKWGGANVIVTNNDPRDLGKLENYFDVIVVDAPCSGSGLFRREPEAMNEWSLDNVQLCHQRQQRILADCWPALRQGGLLIYSTCSYSKEEDEDILDWMMTEWDVSSLRMQPDPAWHIVETMGEKGGWGYRFYPDQLRGEGLFITCLHKNDGGIFAYPKARKNPLEKASRQETETLAGWVKTEQPLFFFRHDEIIHALPAALAGDLSWLQSTCYLKRAGIPLGKLTAKEFIPEHDLALSAMTNSQLTAIDVSREDAIKYLRKEDIGLLPAMKGWALVRYGGQRLGWVKLLGNRINNYYPKEWRILKRDP